MAVVATPFPIPKSPREPREGELLAMSRPFLDGLETVDEYARVLYAELTNGDVFRAEMAPETAWHLTTFARDLREYGQWIAKNGEKIDRWIELHMNGSDVGDFDA
jgi:hypothetical protein